VVVLGRKIHHQPDKTEAGEEDDGKVPWSEVVRVRDVRTPAGAPVYVGPLTWDDAGWRNCPSCGVEWVGEGPCFLGPRHPGRGGRLASWCSHGLRRVPGASGRLCPDCDRHEVSEFTPQFVELLVVADDQAGSSS
jgi:hypothetical protein